MKNLTVNEILNRVATAIMGIEAVSDPFGSSDKHYVQLKSLLQDSGDELVQAHDWEILQKEHNFTTTAGGNPYTLPSDYDRMIPGTHWDRASDLPVGGSLSAQAWQYLLGRDLVTSTIYASFRQKEGDIHIFPDEANFEIYFEYISKNWVQDGASPTTYKDEISDGADVVLFDSALIRNYLRAKYYQAKGFDGPEPEKVAARFFHGRAGKDTAPPVISMGNMGPQYPYLDGFRNTPDTGFGS